MSVHGSSKEKEVVPVANNFGQAADQTTYKETVKDKCIACLVGVAAVVFRVDQWNMDNVPAKRNDEPTQNGMG